MNASPQPEFRLQKHLPLVDFLTFWDTRNGYDYIGATLKDLFNATADLLHALSSSFPEDEPTPVLTNSNNVYEGK
jgi:hypothetical protein